MQHTRTPFLFLSLAMAISTFAPSVTHAQFAIGALADTSGQLSYDNRNDNASSSGRTASTTDEVRASATSSAYRADSGDRNASTNDRVDGLLTAQSHRSVVAAFVQSLLAVADREGGLGAPVRIIAEAQRDSEATTTEAIEKVASRSSLKTLLIGSDDTNLDIIRSEMTQTKNHLDRLSVILASAIEATDRATLSTQISALALDQANIRSFVAAHENLFSFFGWFVRLF